MTRHLRLLALALALTGCSTLDPTNRDPQGLTGEWRGTVREGSSTDDVTLDLSASDGAVDGVGVIVRGGHAYPLGVSGGLSGSLVTLDLTGGGLEPQVYTAYLSGGTMTGSLRGPGFDNVTLVLTRQ